MFTELIDRHQIPVECPRCRYTTDITVREARLEVSYLCPGCRSTIRFIEDGSTRSGLRQVRRAGERLQRSFEKLNRSGIIKASWSWGKRR